MNDGRIAKGKLGEDLAVKTLLDQGFLMRSRNYRTRGGEIDIVAEKNDCLFFVEVRSKSSDRFGIAAESVTKKKRQKIAQTAEIYLSENHLDLLCAFLLVAIDLKK